MMIHYLLLMIYYLLVVLYYLTLKINYLLMVLYYLLLVINYLVLLSTRGCFYLVFTVSMLKLGLCLVPALSIAAVCYYVSCHVRLLFSQVLFVGVLFCFFCIFA